MRASVEDADHFPYGEAVPLHVRQRKIGSTGQFTTKDLASELVATAEMASLVMQKKSKGHVEVPATEVAPLAPALPKDETGPGLSSLLAAIWKDPALKASLAQKLGVKIPEDLAQWREAERELLEGDYLNLASSLSSLAWLAELPHLRTLALKISDENDLAPLGRLSSLESLELKGETKKFVDLSFCRGLKKLEILDLRGPRVESLAPLAGLSRLEKICITKGAIDDLGPLAGLKNLRQVFLPNQQFTSLAPLEKLTGLTYLQVPGNKVDDVAPLAKLGKLTFLGLKNNLVRDVTPLAGLKDLETIYLEGNPVADTSPLRGLEKVEDKDFAINAGTKPTLSPALASRLQALASTEECRALLDTLLARLTDVSETKGVVTLRFDADNNDVVPLEISPPFEGKVPGAPASYAEVITKVGTRVFVDARGSGSSGPCVGVSRDGTVVADCEWEGDEDRSRFSGMCSAGQNWFVWDAHEKNKAGEPGIVFFSHEGALDPKKRFPGQDTIAFGVGGFLLRALAFRVLTQEPAWRGCGWG